MLANYQTIFNTFGINHLPLAGDNQGFHKSLNFRARLADPATNGNQIALYSKLDGSGVTQLFFRPDTNQTPIQMTNSNLNTSNGASQSSFFAGPFTFYVGFRFNVASGTTITLTPSTTLIYVGIGTLFNSAISPIQDAIATNIIGNQFQVEFTSTVLVNPTIYYFAIGST